MLKELKILLAEREISFKYRNNHIACFPHVINLCTQEIIKALTNIDLIGTDDDSGSDPKGKDKKNATDSDSDSEDSEDEAEDDPASDTSDNHDLEGEDAQPEAQAPAPAKEHNYSSTRKGAATQEAALKADVISLARKIVREFRSSGQRRESFIEMIEVGNKKGWFQIDGQATEVQPLQLLRDVRHRWDSLFLMIKHILELQPVCNLILS